MHTVQVGQERSFIFFMSYVLHSFLHSITRRRSFSQSKSLETKLNRCLSTSQLIFYGISHMIGAGIYVLTGHIIKDRVGSATNLSFLFSGLISIFTGLCYCEFSTLIPKAGSCYTYTYLMMGELPAFIVGWTMILDSIVSLASVSKGFSGAVNILCNDAVKNFTDKYLPLSKSSDVWESSADVLAFALLFTLFLITLTGANISMNINLVLSTIQLIFLSVIIIYCFVYGSHQNFVSDGGYLPFGFGSIFQGAGIAIFAYSGFECLANSAEETKNPRKSIPVALFVSLGIIILLYVLASSGLSFMVPRLQIDQKAPFIAAFSNRNLFALKWITGIATLLATGATKLAVFYVIPRMIYTMAEDGLIFKFLGKIDERSKIPIYAVLVGLFFSSLLAIFIKIQVLADITSMGIILSFITIGIDLIILRYIFDENNENTIDNSQKLPMRINTNSMICTRKFFKISLFSLIISIILTGVSILFILPISQITGIIFSAIFILLILTFTIIISLYEPTDVKDTFKTPLMPLTPIITICLNICLLMNLPGSTWLRFLVLTVIVKKYYGHATRKRVLSKNKSLDTKLHRCLSTYQLIFYGISHMIGAGIYILTGHIIKEKVGPATNLSFVLSGLVSIFTGLCYCEFATLIPKAGSCYTYTYLMMGELPAFIIGWTMIMDLSISLSSIAKGFSGAVNLLSNNAVKNFTDRYVPLTPDSEIWDTSVDLVALLLLFTLFLLTLTGANISLNINAVLAALQLIFLTTIIISCFVYGNSQNYFADGGYLPFGVASIFQGAGIGIYAYSGFECLSNSAEETKEPRKSIPTALFVSLGIVIVLYVLTSTGLSFMVPRLQINENAPFISAFTGKSLHELKWLTGIATLLATGASKLAAIYVIPRMIYAMAEDGLLFRFLDKVNESSKVPTNALVVGVLFSTILAMFVRIQILAEITSMGIIISFMIVGVDLIILRYLHNEELENIESNESKNLEMRFTIFSGLANRTCFKGIFICLLFSIIFMGLSILLLYPIHYISGIICSVFCLITLLTMSLLLSLYKPLLTKDAFATPLMPLTPIITITLNICLLINLPLETWIRFLVWILFGLLIYFFYGIPNSHLSEKAEEKTELILLDNNNDEILKQE